MKKRQCIHEYTAYRTFQDVFVCILTGNTFIRVLYYNYLNTYFYFYSIVYTLYNSSTSILFNF